MSIYKISYYCEVERLEEPVNSDWVHDWEWIEDVVHQSIWSNAWGQIFWITPISSPSCCWVVSKDSSKLHQLNTSERERNKRR